MAQLSNRVQYTLRAHTPDDEAALKATIRTFPKTSYYDLQETITSLGISEAIVTSLSPKGVPTPVVATRMVPPTSRLGPLLPEEFPAEEAESDLMREYGTPIDRESAHEILARRLELPEPVSRTGAAQSPGPRRQELGAGSRRRARW